MVLRSRPANLAVYTGFQSPLRYYEMVIIESVMVLTFPKAPRTHTLRLSGPKTILHRAFGAILSLRV